MRKITRKTWVPMALTMAGFLMAAAQSQAMTYGFMNISANNVNNAASGEAQLSVEVTDAGTGQVLFTFNNAGPEAMSITDVYFDDGHLLGISSIESSDGVIYSQGASPGNLPSANNINPAFSTTAGFSADSDPAIVPNGVNPGEWLKIYFDLKEDSQTYQTVLDDLANGSLRIGIHVQGFVNGGSEAFVNGGGGGQTVPDASATCMLLGLALIGVEGFRRRFGR